MVSSFKKPECISLPCYMIRRIRQLLSNLFFVQPPCMLTITIADKIPSADMVRPDLCTRVGGLLV